MLFNTPQYILFLPVVVIIYYCMPQRSRYIWLLVASYYFYVQWNPIYIVLLFFCTLLTYICGRIIEYLKVNEESAGEDSIPGQEINVEKTISRGNNAAVMQYRKKKKLCFVACIVLCLGILGFFKYSDFAISLVNHLLTRIHINPIDWDYDIILPVGISFYTLQALGYVIDVYRGDIYAEKNFMRYALFVSFFPQLVAGPIERSKNLLVQINTPKSFQYENLRKGLLLVLYGLFLKMVIADRTAIIVNTVYGNSEDYPGFYIIAATVFFAIQIYCDFYGYSTIARGSALMMGFCLMDNFNAPYYSKSVKEFWRRWHISLSGWFRDYLYIPLGGSRKGILRKWCNLLIVFMVSGLWHGASTAFIFWGLLNGLYQVAEDLIAGAKEYFAKYYMKWKRFIGEMEEDNKIRFSTNLFHTIVTFMLVTFSWLFFRAGGLEDALEILRHVISVNNWFILFDGSMYGLGVARNYMNVLLVAILVLFVVDYHKYRGQDVADMLLRQGWWFRVTCIMLLIFTILLYGCYGELYDIQQFIYFQF